MSKRTHASVLALGLLALLQVAGCGGDDGTKSKPQPPVPPTPLAFTRQTRALVIGPQDGEVVAASAGTLVPATIAQDFPHVVLRQQLHDQISLDADISTTGGAASEEDRSFAVRIAADWATVAQDYPGFENAVIVLDLLTADGSSLVAPDSINPLDRSFAKGPSSKYSLLVLHQLQAALDALGATIPKQTKLLYVIGEGLNGQDAAEFAKFKTLYADYLYPAVQAAAQAQGREIQATTSIDWEAFVAAVPQPAAGAPADAAAAALADSTAWASLVDGLTGKLDLIVVQSVPRAYDTLAELPGDYYQRLADVLQPNQPVAFLPLYWPCQSAGDVTTARELLDQFHFLAAGLNLAFFAWPRFIDLTDTECGRFHTNLGGPTDLCYAGLVKSAGKPKSLWDALHDERTPQATACDANYPCVVEGKDCRNGFCL